MSVTSLLLFVARVSARSPILWRGVDQVLENLPRPMYRANPMMAKMMRIVISTMVLLCVDNGVRGHSELGRAHHLPAYIRAGVVGRRVGHCLPLHHNLPRWFTRYRPRGWSQRTTPRA
jgi:hypothetical protein